MDMELNTYTVSCSCGHDIKVNAPDMETAIRQMKMMMDGEGIEDHFDTYHKGQDIPTVDEVHAHIEQDIEEMVMA